jgi:hypothetical protein
MSWISKKILGSLVTDIRRIAKSTQEIRATDSEQEWAIQTNPKPLFSIEINDQYNGLKLNEKGNASDNLKNLFSNKKFPIPYGKVSIDNHVWKVVNYNPREIINKVYVIKKENNKLVVYKAKGRPVYVRREDIMDKSFWPDWSYIIILLFNSFRISKYKERANLFYKLYIDLREESYGIYNNSGKRFLRDTWDVGDDFKTECSKRSKEIMDFISNQREESKEWNCSNMPLRWASGGCLPIVNWKGKKWFIMLFRDINPIGWNIANGASESKDEYKEKLDQLIRREFSEELLVLSCGPMEQLDQRCDYFPFHFLLDSGYVSIEKLVEDHIEFRAIHDNITIDKSNNHSIEIETLRTPCQLSLKYHTLSFKDDTKEFHDILFLINPCEFGIETIKVFEFTVPDDVCILDGEINKVMGYRYLVRQPVALFSVECLRNIYNKNQEDLGSIIPSHLHIDCKSIGKIEKGDFHFFNKEIVLRQQRLNYLKSITKKRKPGESYEMDRLESWFENFGKQFENIDNLDELDPKTHPDLLSFCPVSWKAIEQVFRYGILNS